MVGTWVQTDTGHAYVVRPAKTDRVGFLHLTRELRVRIYEEVLFDHDHDLVLLPRALPRKVNADGECMTLGMLGETAEESSTEGFPNTYTSLNLSCNILYLDCHWVDDEVCLPEPRFASDEERAFDGYSSDEAVDKSFAETSKIVADHQHFSCAVDRCKTCNLIYCECDESESTKTECDGTDEEVPDNSPTESNEPKGSDNRQPQFDEDGYLIAPQVCLDRECKDKIYEDELQYFDEEDDDRLRADQSGDDLEHFDSEECIGMIFERSEPGILLACKEIRQECLPLYYVLNAFSWRFFWLDMRRSLTRFTAWIHSLSDNTQHIRRVSFEGRHAWEEGIDFNVDIDLLDSFPFFNINAEAFYSEEDILETICAAIENELTTLLWKMSVRDGGRSVFSPNDLIVLGTAFANAMQRDPGDWEGGS